MTALSSAQLWHKVLTLLTTMKRRGVQLDRTCYSCAVSAACKLGSTAQAQSLLQEMRAAGIAPQIADYNSLLAQLTRKKGRDIGNQIGTQIDSIGSGIDAVVTGVAGAVSGGSGSGSSSSGDGGTLAA